MTQEGTPPDESTARSEPADAEAKHDPGRPPIIDDERAADRARSASRLSGELDEVGEHVTEMNTRGPTRRAKAGSREPVGQIGRSLTAPG